MEFVRILSESDNLWAVKDPKKKLDELTDWLRKIQNPEILLDFFKNNCNDLKQNFNIEKISKAINDTIEDANALQTLILEFPYYENLDKIFRPLGSSDLTIQELSREKTRNWNRKEHASWVRIYAIRIEPNVYIITGGAIKLTRTMQERPHTQKELKKLNECRDYLIANGIFDEDSFIDYTSED